VIRARTLFPLRNGSATVAAKPTAERIWQHRTDTGYAPDKHRMPRALVSAALVPLSRATLDGSTRLRAERPTAPRREPISSRTPATALFSVVTNKLPKVAVQFPKWG